MLQVYGLLSSAAQWCFYCCDPDVPCPFSFYALSIDLTHSHSVSDVSKATRGLLEHLLGFLILCLEEAAHT